VAEVYSWAFKDPDIQKYLIDRYLDHLPDWNPKAAKEA